MTLPEQPAGLLLPDHLGMMESLEDAPDPFFGVMEVEPSLPSPMNIPQIRHLLETPSPERRRLEHTPPRPRTRKPAIDRDLQSSPEKITLVEEVSIKMPEVEFDRDLQEITTHELEFLMAEEVPIQPPEEPIQPRERRATPRRKPSVYEPVEKGRAPELEVSMAPVSPISRLPEEPGPELDSVILLDEVTGEPIIVPPAPEPPELPTEVTPIEPQVPSLQQAELSPAVVERPRSPQLELADIYELPGAGPRRRRRQLRFIDQVTQIPPEVIKQLLEDAQAHCQTRPPVELPHKRRKNPKELLNNPTYDRWIPPELRCLWSRCAQVEAVDYDRLRAAAAAEEEEKEAEEERKRQQESVSELELLREEEQTAPLLLSSEITLETSEEERSRVMMMTPEERRATMEVEEPTLPIVFEQPEPMISEPQVDSEQITPEFVHRMLHHQIEQFGETDFETLVPYNFSRLIAGKIFFCCLVLSSIQILVLEQEEPFKRIVIKPGPRFYQ
ncbi:meiotic recombination protein REC8 homolog [Pleurodeles waltl]|uniref:meiotic recombination protein REC8 homolog n=1 Tax=Pleurodeles waltl TaxID=8319 RepID=UPI00370965FD